MTPTPPDKDDHSEHQHDFIAIPPSPLMIENGNDYYTCNQCGKKLIDYSLGTKSDKDELLEQPYHIYEGTKIKFFNEKQAYTVQCNSERFTICTKPLNIHKTVLYTIIDWKEQRRGLEDLVFGMGAETKEQCLEMLVRLLDGRSGRSQVSFRHDVPLNRTYGIEWIKNGKEFVYRHATLEQSLKETK